MLQLDPYTICMLLRPWAYMGHAGDSADQDYDLLQSAPGGRDSVEYAQSIPVAAGEQAAMARAVANDTRILAEWVLMD